MFIRSIKVTSKKPLQILFESCQDFEFLCPYSSFRIQDFSVSSSFKNIHKRSKIETRFSLK